jgi:hypothetical protein
MKLLATFASLLVVAAACGSASQPAPAPSGSASGTGTAVAPPSASAATDCGTVDSETSSVDERRVAGQCLVDAFNAGTAATLQWRSTSDEGGKTITDYRVVPGAGGAPVLERTINDQDDQFSEQPGVHVATCKSVRLEPTQRGPVVYPVDCS